MLPFIGSSGLNEQILTYTIPSIPKFHLNTVHCKIAFFNLIFNITIKILYVVTCKSSNTVCVRLLVKYEIEEP